MAHRYFTEAENREFYASRPQKVVGVMVVCRDPEGRVLIVKPSYKPGWNLVGGFVDTGESPFSAALREMHEEIGLKLPDDRLSLLGVQYLPPVKFGEFLRIMFVANLTTDEVAGIRLQSDEIEEHRFVTMSNLEQYNERPVIDAARALLAQDQPGYVENRTLRGAL